MKYLLLPFFFIANFANAQYELRLNLEKGKTYFHHSSSTLIIDQDINGQKVNVTSTIKGGMSYKVLDKSDTTYTLETTYTSLSLGMKGPTGDISFSSEKPYDANDAMSNILKAMVNHSFVVVMLSNGKISAVRGIDSLWSNMVNNLSEIPKQKRDQILAQLKQSYGENTLKSNMEMLTAIFPSKKVKVNDQWENAIQMKSTMNLITHNRFKLVDYNAYFYDITNHAEVKTSNDTVTVNEMPVIYNLSGPIDSKIKVDTKTGWIINADLHQELKGDFIILDNPKVPGGLTVGMSMINVSLFGGKEPEKGK
jgi:hypothetical protein